MSPDEQVIYVRLDFAERAPAGPPILRDVPSVPPPCTIDERCASVRFLLHGFLLGHSECRDCWPDFLTLFHLTLLMIISGTAPPPTVSVSPSTSASMFSNVS